MRFLLAVVLVLTASVAWAAPFIVCDSYTAPAVIPDYFKVSLDGAPEVQSPPWSGTLPGGAVLQNAVHFDVGTVSVGTHALQIKACKAGTIYDPEACSVAVPFSWVRGAPPVAPGTPSGFILSR